MTQFVETNDGWVNLAHVAKIKERNNHANSGLIFYGVDGKVLGAKSCLDEPFNPSDISPVVVPAAPGSMAVVIWAVNNEEECPYETETETFPIVAWAIVEGVGRPILPNKGLMDDGAVVFIQLDDGRLVESCDGICANLTEAQEYVLNNARVKWDCQKRRLKVA
jgi:hypothetical protein